MIREYAVSDGEGTLLEYGVLYEAFDVKIILDPIKAGYTVIIERCSPDCETGKMDQSPC